MYILKENIDINVNKTEASKIIGISRVYLTDILNRRTKCTKVIAFCITKFFDLNAEISDYFEKKGE